MKNHEKNCHLFGSKKLYKFFRVMKLTIALTIFCLMQVSATVYTQTNQFTLNVKNKQILDVLKEIENQSDYRFFYQDEQIDVGRKVTVNMNNRNFEYVIRELFSIQNVVYKIFDNGVVLLTVNRIEKNQEITIKGKVTDVSGSPLPGVNVVEKGTINGAITDLDGNYSLAVSSNDAILSFSYVGYLTEEIKIAGQTTVDLTMIEDIKSLDEVVVIGYGTVKKSDLTGSVFSIKEDQLQSGISENIDGKLKGKIPGLSIMQTSGSPGSQPRIRIRGNNSITGSNRPLYVVDGVPFDDSPIGGGLADNLTNNQTSGLNAINSNDIESLEILKGPSAVAIYGSRGSNGVILITTKQGKEGKVRVNYSVETGIKQASKKLDLLTTDEYIKVRNDIAAEYDESPVFTESEIANITGTDWQEEIFRNGTYQNQNLSFSGGNDFGKYYASFNYFDEKGIIISSGIKKYNARLNMELNGGDKFTFGIRFNTNRTDNDLIQEGAENEHAGVINGAHNMDPTISSEPQEDGRYLIAHNLENPLNAASGYLGNKIINRTYGAATAQYKISQELSLNLKFGADLQNVQKTLYRTRQTIVGLASGGIANVVDANVFNTLYEGTFNYNKSFGDNQINLLGGMTYEKFISENNGITISGFPTDETMQYNLGLGDTELDNVSSGYAAHSLLSYIARVNYSNAGKYLFTATFRADGSSRFGENNKFGYFPSVAFAWRLSEEEFIKNLSVFSNLKLRTSWGLTGNQEIGNYQSLTTFSVAGTPISLNNTLIPVLEAARIPNPDLKWEEKEEYNIGIDIGVFNGKISGSVDYFKQKTHDLLFNKPIPSNSGFSSVLSNIGKVENAGIEVLIETVNLDGEFSWKSSINFSYVKNKVLDLGPVDQIVHGSVGWTSQIGLIREGDPMNSYYGHEVEGIWQEGDDIANSAQPTAKPGYIKFKDQNGDNQINAEDLVTMGNPEPELTYGLTNTFSYKNFDFIVFIQGVEGVTLLNYTYLRSFYPIDYTRNRMAEPWLNRWTPANKTNEFPSGVDYNAYGGSQVNDLTLQDASFLRIQNIQLSYNIPLNKVKFIRSANISFMVNNAFTFTKYNGYNPEAAQGTEMVVRADYCAYPLARTYSMGINLGF